MQIRVRYDVLIKIITGYTYIFQLPPPVSKETSTALTLSLRTSAQCLLFGLGICFLGFFMILSTEFI